MTTIAWNKKMLSVDSAFEGDGVIIETTGKKLFLNVGNYRAVAIAGPVVEMMCFLSWLDGENGDCPDFDGAAIAVGMNNKIYGFYGEGKGYGHKEPTCSAQGSGFKLAIGAMDAGATPEEAVKIAVKRDICTGGRVHTFKIKD